MATPLEEQNALNEQATASTNQATTQTDQQTASTNQSDVTGSGLQSGTTGGQQVQGTIDQTKSALSGVDAGSAGKSYQDLGKARLDSGTPDFARYEKTAEGPAVTDAQKYMTPETTVAGQLEKILSKDSGLSKLTKAQSRAEASALGMLSSSDYIGASQRALLKTGLEIAKPDAETAKQFKMQEQQTQNRLTEIENEAQISGDLTLQKARINETQKKIDDAFALTLKGLDAESARNMENLRGEWQTKFKELDAKLSRELTQQEIDAQTEQKIMTQAHDMMNQYQISVQQLLANESFLESMGGNRAAMNNVFNDMLASVTSSIEFSAKAAGVYNTKFAGYLKDLVADAGW